MRIINNKLLYQILSHHLCLKAPHITIQFYNCNNKLTLKLGEKGKTFSSLYALPHISGLGNFFLSANSLR